MTEPHSIGSDFADCKKLVINPPKKPRNKVFVPPMKSSPKPLTIPCMYTSQSFTNSPNHMNVLQKASYHWKIVWLRNIVCITSATQRKCPSCVMPCEKSSKENMLCCKTGRRSLHFKQWDPGKFVP
ncbi:hypothetical protein TSUD_182960 [Trifolium subterraneum]|uniref:Uncharacterized protein n=1 Tax=Trifolium subterraneum TaxID=3900 RepID=A0A2Z6PK77_TRISU|nr:hypothetical protein TSUD_182960 [Trifolium subterraneum]